MIEPEEPLPWDITLAQAAHKRHCCQNKLYSCRKQICSRGGNDTAEDRSVVNPISVLSFSNGNLVLKAVPCAQPAPHPSSP